MIGEAANNGKPGKSPGSTGLRKCRPSERRLGCQMIFAAILDEGEKLTEEFLGSIELKAEAPGGIAFDASKLGDAPLGPSACRRG